jgi:hypothetical protein
VAGMLVVTTSVRVVVTARSLPVHGRRRVVRSLVAMLSPLSRGVPMTFLVVHGLTSGVDLEYSPGVS